MAIAVVRRAVNRCVTVILVPLREVVQSMAGLTNQDFVALINSEVRSRFATGGQP